MRILFQSFKTHAVSVFPWNSRGRQFRSNKKKLSDFSREKTAQKIDRDKIRNAIEHLVFWGVFKNSSWTASELLVIKSVKQTWEDVEAG